MEIILIPLIYYAFWGFAIIFSIINNLDLILKVTNNKALLNVYLFVELLVSGTLITYSLVNSNYVLLIIGSFIFLSGLLSIWAREEMIKMMNEIGNRYDLIGAFMCFILVALIYFFDSTSSII